jgi:glycosyltransferase involved in cell wall biosynthesis
VRLFGRRHSPAATAAFAAGVAANEALRAPRHPKHRAALRALVDPSRRRTSTVPKREPSTDGVICFSALDWWYHNHAHADFQLMRRVAASRRVLFVNSIGMRMPLPGRSTQPLRRIVRKVRSISRALQAPVPDLPDYHVLSPAVLPFYGTPAIRALNTRLVTWQVRRAARRLGLEMPTCLVTIPTAWAAARRLPVRSVIYNRSDKHSEFGETDQTYIRDLEEQLLRGADRVLYVSRALMEQESAYTAGRARFLDHGVDLDRFRLGLPESADLADIGRPRLGFFGGFDDYVIDFDLLERLAKSIPEAEVILIGDATCSMDRLTSQPNVTWLGYRPYEQIPSLGAGFDVALMPWQQNGWIEACNPIKLKEYLALGLPVVSTDFPEVRHYDHVVRVAHDHDSFVDLVRETMRDGGPGTPESRHAVVSGSSWERRAQELIELCDESGTSR